MKTFFLPALLVLAACNSEPPSTATTDTRVPLAVQYVRGAALKIHAAPSDDATIVTSYLHGESVSVLSHKGAWAEVRLAEGSGWVHASELATALEAEKAEADNLSPHFTRTPEPVTQPGAHGDIVFEADIDTEGNVGSIRTLRNTTGQKSLEERNAAALKQARFTPVVRHGKRESFIYEHRVHY